MVVVGGCRVEGADTGAQRVVRQDRQQCNDRVRHLARASRPGHSVLVPGAPAGGGGAPCTRATQGTHPDRVDGRADVSAAHRACPADRHGQLQLRAYHGGER